MEPEVIRTNGNVQERRILERTAAENAQLKANLDYVAMMSEIDIPTDDEEEGAQNE